MYRITINRQSLENKIGERLGYYHIRILELLNDREFYREMDLNYRHIIQDIYDKLFKCRIEVIIGVERRIMELLVEDQTEALLFKLKFI